MCDLPEPEIWQAGDGLPPELDEDDDWEDLGS